MVRNLGLKLARRWGVFALPLIFSVAASHFGKKAERADSDGHQPYYCPNYERARRGFGGGEYNPGAKPDCSH